MAIPQRWKLMLRASRGDGEKLQDFCDSSVALFDFYGALAATKMVFKLERCLLSFYTHKLYYY